MEYPSKKLFWKVLEGSQIDLAEAAALVGRNSKQSLSNVVNRGCLSVDEFLLLLNKMGLKLEIVREDGYVIREKSSRPRVLKYIEGVRCNTTESYVITSSAYKNPDGTEFYNHEVTELLCTKTGEKYMTTWYDDGRNPHLRFEDENYQDSFNAQYGDIKYW